MQTVRAKFRCVEISSNSDGTDVNIILHPVTSGSKENESFYKYTPSGRIELGVVNPSAAGYFVKDAEYYVDFQKAEGEQP